MKWEILNNDGDRGELLNVLLLNRGITGKKAVRDFLNPLEPDQLQATKLGISAGQLAKALARIKRAVSAKEPIVVYGDYDADGICATAIIWEALRDLGALAMPFIPRREIEGYGLSREGIDEILKDEKYGIRGQGKKGGLGLVVVVDSGVVAHEAVEYAKQKGIEVVIIDHHELPEKLPKAAAIVHTTQLCASGIAYYVALRLLQNSKYKEQDTDRWLELACIATVTDLIPLVGPNRSIVKCGLKRLNETTRPGLRALFSVAGISRVGTYEIGFMIGPRINASGRIENALTALRLLCGSDEGKAAEYARLLNETNKERQTMTEEMTMHAMQNSEFRIRNSGEKIIVIEHESYHQGVIGLIAGKLVERYYLPAIVIAKGETLSKASARSIAGFNIIEAIRSTDSILINAGGHPMAAGFTIETTRIAEFKEAINKIAAKRVTADLLDRVLRIDCFLNLEEINMDWYQKIRQFEPFGLGNPEPAFASTVTIQNVRTVGQDGKHLKLQVGLPVVFDAIAFNQGRLASQLKVGDQVQIAYTIAIDNFNGGSKLQLKVKDIRQI